MMTVENPETTISVAPGEGQKPLFIMSDVHFEAMFNPDKFCYGSGTFNSAPGYLLLFTHLLCLGRVVRIVLCMYANFLCYNC